LNSEHFSPPSSRRIRRSLYGAFTRQSPADGIAVVRRSDKNSGK
jgi:hypothetical protein